jgi:ADP-ribosylglycohydrolase
MLPDSNTKETLGKIRDLRSPVGKVAQITGVSGYSAESVPLALYTARAGKAVGFRRAVIEACCCGGDADTIAAIAGQIMASKGLPVPADWAEKVPQREQIIAIGKLLGDVASARG